MGAKECLLLATLLLAGQDIAAAPPNVSLAGGDSGQIRFASAGSIVKATESDRYVVSDTSLTLSGELQLPQGSAPFPVVVLAHTCAGLGYGEMTWIPRLHQWGYATFVVDSLSARSIQGLCSDPWQLLPFQRVPDLYGALRILATHPRIDANNAFLLGFSHGAIAAINAATMWAKETYAGADRPRFRAFFAFYPYCNSEYPERESLYAPIRVHIGEQDDWTPAATCQAWIEKLRVKGYDGSITVYPNAHHAFDMPYGPVIRLPDVTNLARCSARYPSLLGPLNLADNFGSCATKGAIVGRNAEAIEQAANVLHEQLEGLRTTGGEKR
ncbi:MAG TPA: dienelactone hydrolase family protein [Burkholderiales bacterium]|nr:dienelactone hydrolase family protein [Burkholderiales bacterium]